MNMNNNNNNNSPQSSLPPGFRFHPTDEELILHYLVKKVTSTPFNNSIIAEVDIYKFDPWDLPGKAVFGEKEWYFFSPRDRKYPNGVRPNRAAASGYWKATGTDKIIMASGDGGGGGGRGHHHQQNIGVKKALVFYQGRPPRGIKTNWIMHEYRLAQSPTHSIHKHKPPVKLRDSSMRLDDWVLCRIYKKSNAGAAAAAGTDEEDVQEQEDSLMEDSLRSHHNNNQNAIVQPPPQNKPSSSFSNMLDVMIDSSVFGHHLFPDAAAAFELSTPTVEYGSLGQSNTNTLPIIAENQLMKRQHWSMMDVAGDVQLPCPPSKRLALSSSSTLTPTNPNQSDCFNNNNQSSLFNQSLYFNHNYQQFQG